MCDISLEEIENIGEFMEGEGILSRHNLASADIIGLDDIKEILRLKFYPIEDDVASDIRKNETCRKYSDLMMNIQQMMININKIIQCPEFLNEFGGLYQDSNDMNRKMMTHLRELIEIKKFPIVFVGEGNAGKSSIINLLIGCPLMPVSTLSCTRIMCEVRNSLSKRATFIVDENDKTKDEVIEHFDDAMVRIAEIVTEQENQTFRKGIFEYPVEFIDEYTCLVDSPGIGHTDALDKVTFSYLNKDTAAFIFVLNANNSCGLNKKSMNLIECAKERLKRCGGYLFTDDVSINQDKCQNGKAIFILNHWDDIEKKDKENEISEISDIRKNTIKQLQLLWDDSLTEGTQIFFISATKAQSWVNVGVIPKELVKLRLSLTNLAVRVYELNFQNCLSILRSTLDYLERIILQKINSNVDKKYSQLFNKTHTKKLCALLKKTLANSSKRKREINNALQPTISSMIISLTQHLKSSDVENRMICAFTECMNSQNPCTSLTQKIKKISVAMIKSRLRKTVEKQMHFELKKWDENSNAIENLNSLMKHEFDKHILEIRKEINIENNFISEGFLRSSWASCLEIKLKLSSDKSSITKVEKVLIFTSITLLFPVVAIAALMVSPLIVSHVLKVSKEAGTRKGNNEIAENRYFTEVIKQTLKNISEDYTRNNFFSSLLVKLNETIDSFDEFIQSELNIKHQLMKDVDNETRSIPRILCSLNDLLRKTERCYGDYHIFRNTHLPDISLMVRCPLSLFGGASKPEMEETILMCGCSVLFRANKEKNVLFKMYSKKFNKQFARSQMQEIQILSTWPFPFLLGLRSYCYLEKEEKLLLTMDNVDCNLEKYFENNRDMIPSLYNRESPIWKRAFGFVLDISKQICTCLDILHNFDVRMVHSDLKIDTVLVKKVEDPNKVDIFICDVCTNLPTRRTRQKIDYSQTENLELCFDMGGYTKENIYRLGIIFYKMAHFRFERKTSSKSLSEIYEANEKIENYLTSINLLESDIEIDWNDGKHFNIPEEYNILIKRCMSVKPEYRPCAKECYKIISNINV